MQERRPVTPLKALARPEATIATAALATVASDQLTKWWALERLADGPVHVVWTLYFNLSFNTGVAFGLAKGIAPLIVAAAVVLLAILIRMRGMVANRPMAVGLGLLVGGASGNVIDRVVRGHGGAVVDFIDLTWWPVFNLADAAIVIGAGLLVLAAPRRAPRDDDGQMQGEPAEEPVSRPR